MLIRTSLWCLLAVLAAVVAHQSCQCQGYQIELSPAGATSHRHQDRRVPRRPQLKEDEDSSLADLFEVDSSEESADDHSPLREEGDSSGAADEIRSPVLAIPLTKRRKGPTLSVVNPLEILRQRLMLDMAQRRIDKNKQQIVANAQLLEDIGKRSSSPLRRYQP